MVSKFRPKSTYRDVTADDVVSVRVMYESGMSMQQIAAAIGDNYSRIRRIFSVGKIQARSSNCLSEAGRRAKRAAGKRLRGRRFSKETIERMRAAAVARHKDTARGTRITPSGYVEYTTGEYKGRSVHVVTMEALIGRRLIRGEVVHHIDEDPANNDASNLRLMTRAEHTALHRRTRVGQASSTLEGSALRADASSVELEQAPGDGQERNGGM